ncbi:DUF2927 domain-containing protein [Jhaorihella thermophila]|uniref:ATP-dependent transcriptional regulator n=1 Tax=Jhaorihella thermophila TaxID=488547 RepID=A0A1H5WX39_9RHOB|nr:DUF2927 domain-containing protein [Jhaorihella thermophila]SEG03646.1 Protein of unknown function [Jhaorihella thermophila]
MIRAVLIAAALGLAGCAAAPTREVPTRAAHSHDSALPPMKSFTAAHPAAPIRSNANIAADFLDLHFQLESGRALPVFSRFEGPITVRVTGSPPPTLRPDLRRLLARLRNEAGIDISETTGAGASITIQAVSRADIRRALPDAACFVVPNVSSLAEFRRDRRKPSTSWSRLTTRTRLGIFVPYDASPQEIRDCLHEELAQALGPVNDLYRLPDSVFNDDNVHAVLTGFDMLILRATYAPELHSGMSKAQVAARLPAILARLNPRGSTLPPAPVSPTPRAWSDAVQTALGPGARPDQRRAAAERALSIAQAQGWTDHRLAFSYYILGRMTDAYDTTLAERYYEAAQFFLSRTPGTQVQRAYVATQTAAHALAAGDPARALTQIEPNLAVAAQAENASLLATLMLLKAQALEQAGRRDEARAVRLDSLGWARYGFGSDWAVQAKIQEIAALDPWKNLGG